jgi:hypothetical protein
LGAAQCGNKREDLMNRAIDRAYGEFLTLAGPVLNGTGVLAQQLAPVISQCFGAFPVEQRADAVKMFMAAHPQCCHLEEEIITEGVIEPYLIEMADKRTVDTVRNVLAVYQMFGEELAEEEVVWTKVTQFFEQFSAQERARLYWEFFLKTTRSQSPYYWLCQRLSKYLEVDYLEPLVEVADSPHDALYRAAIWQAVGNAAYFEAGLKPEEEQPFPVSRLNSALLATHDGDGKVTCQ